jgi:hypothetical protein
VWVIMAERMHVCIVGYKREWLSNMKVKKYTMV